VDAAKWCVHLCLIYAVKCFLFNFSKTKFLLIGLKQQLAKIRNSSHNTTHSADILGLIFDECLIFADHISSLSNSWYYHICRLHCILPYLDSKTVGTIAISIMHSKFNYRNSLFYKFPVSPLTHSNRFRNLLCAPLLKLLNPVVSLLFCVLFICLKQETHQEMR